MTEGKKGKPVEPNGCCPAFQRDLSSLEEEPACCENCVVYADGVCRRAVVKAEKTAD